VKIHGNEINEHKRTKEVENMREPTKKPQQTYKRTRENREKKCEEMRRLVLKRDI
jgi:hypothetical protein